MAKEIFQRLFWVLMPAIVFSVMFFAGVLIASPANTQEPAPVEKVWEFKANALAQWGCFVIEDALAVLDTPLLSEFRFRLAEAVVAGKCFDGAPLYVMITERMTYLPAEGERPAVNIWKILDYTGTVAYASYDAGMEPDLPGDQT